MGHHRAGSEYAVVYDVSDDRERRRLDRLLCGFGFRVQKSVFECRLTRAGLTALLRGIEALKLETGSVRLYRVYGGAGQVRTFGGVARAAPDAGLAFTW